MALQQSIMIPMAHLRTNEGQIAGLPKNPRFIKDVKFKNLVQSIRDNPEMISLRELIVFPFKKNQFVIIAGNMRFRALHEVGHEDAPCKVLSKKTPVEKLKAIAMLDNASFGETDWNIIANEWTDDLSQLASWGMDAPSWMDADAPGTGKVEKKTWNVIVKFDNEKDATELHGHLFGQDYDVRIQNVK